MVNSKRTAEGSSVEKGKGGDNGKPAKRSRVSRACDQCRASRERCDGESRCQTCVSQNRSCTYTSQPKKRGIQPHYIRTLELTLAWLLQTFSEAESQLAKNLSQDDHHVTRLLRERDSEASEGLHSAWRNSLICKQIDQLLSGELVEAAGQHLSAHTEAVLNRSGSDFPIYQSPPLSGTFEVGALQRSALDVEVNSGPSPSAVPTQDMSENSTYPNGKVRLPDNALVLLEYYFAFTHSWLPMTEKHSILKLMYSYPNEGIVRNQLGGAEHSELWSIMALASTQLSDHSNQDDSRRIRQIAEDLIPAGDRNASYEVPHIRSMMLLTLIDASEQHMLAAWLRIGTVVSLLLLFNILEKLNVTEKWCRHIHLVAFVLERAIALHLRVPSHLKVSYIEAIGLVDEDGMDEWAPWFDPMDADQKDGRTKAPARSFSTLNELVRQMMRLTEDNQKENRFEQGSTDPTGSPVFALLKNASLKRDRMQPSTLVAQQGLTNPNSNIGQDTEVDPDILGSEFGKNQQVNVNELQNQHAFMSIPNETGTLATHRNVSTGQSGTPFWTSSPSQLVDPGFGLGDGSTDGTDIFEQFDALLERQDSTQHSQFYQNLGFAPDIELAEFFGDAYQPSDPLLAYLNPTLYGLNQSSSATVP